MKNNQLDLGGNTTGNIVFLPNNTSTLTLAPNVATFTGDIYASGTTGLTLSGNGADLNFTGNGINTITTALNQNFAINPGGTGLFGINTDGLTPLANFDVRINSGTLPIASFSGQTSFAALVVDQSGKGDIFTASYSGATRFMIRQNGYVGILTSTPTATLDISGTASLGGQLTFKDTFGAIQTTRNQQLTLGGNTTGNIILEPVNGQAGAFVAPNTNTSVDLGTSALQFRNVYAQNLFTSGTFEGFWQRNLGAVALLNNMDDLLIGGTSTTSSTLAFSITNVAKNQPIASVSGQLIVMPDNGWSGYVGIGTAAPSQALTVNGNVALLPANSFITGSTGLTLQETGDTYGTVALNLQNRNGVNGAMFQQLGSVDLVDFVFKGLTNQRNIRYENRFDNIFVSAPEFEIGGAADPTLVISDYLTLFRKGEVVIGIPASVGQGVATTGATFDVRSIFGTRAVATFSGTTSFAAMVIDQSGLGDLITASAAGATRFVLTRGGQLGLLVATPSAILDVGGNSSLGGQLTFKDTFGAIQTTRNQQLTLGGNTTGNIFLSPLSGAANSFVAPSTNTSVDLGQLTLQWRNVYAQNLFTSGTFGGFWQRNLGAVASLNNTDDLLIGGTSSTAATLAFSVTNLAKKQPVASVSGQLVVYPLNGWGGRVGIGTLNPQATGLEVDAYGGAQTSDLVDIANIAGQEPTVTGINGLQVTWYEKPSAGNLIAAQRTNVFNNNTGAGGSATGLRIVAQGPSTANINTPTVGLFIDGLINANIGTTGQNALMIGPNWDSSILGTGDLRINAGGNIVLATSSASTKVGIQQLTPSAFLDVAGTASIGGQLTFRDTFGAIQTTRNQQLTSEDSTTGSVYFPQTIHKHLH